MTLEEIINEIQKKKDLDLENLSRKFQDDQLKLRLDADRRIKKLLEDYEKKIANEMSMLERKEISEAELDSRTTVRKKYNDLMETGLARAIFYLEDLPQWKTYPEILESMVSMAKKEAGFRMHS
jgi:vacuolar-type H+-ATPase subunit E/Vma4